MMEIPFKHLSAAHCENGVTGNLLRFYGYDYSEPLIFGLSASLYFVHLPFVHLAGFPVTSFRPLPGAIFARATRLLGFKVRRTIFLCPKHAEKKLDRLLVQGIPTGAVVGMYFLPYVPNEYRFHFNAHNICVIGKDGDDYLVSDPVAVEKVKLSAHDMMRARFSKGTYPPMGKLYCYRMLHEPGPVPWVGINAFRHLGNKIPKFPQKYGVRQAALHLGQLVRMMEEIGTGGAGFRFLYAAFLQEAAAITGITALNDFSERLTAIGDEWRMFAAEAARVCKRRSAANVDYQTIGDHLKTIGDREKQFFTDLEKLIKKSR